MKMNKKISLIMLVLAGFLALACLGPVRTLKASEAGGTLPDDLYEFAFKLDGVVYKLPCDYKVFEENGWELQVDPSQEINANTYGITYMTKGDARLSSLIFNPTGNTKKVVDCKISEVTIRASDDVSFELPKGITVKSSVEDIQNAYGTPKSNESESDYQLLSYKKDEYDTNSYVKFVIYKDPSDSYIEVRNMIYQEGDKGEVSTEVPDYLADYKAPAELGDDPASPVFELDGKLYQLPCPLTAFTDNGWTVSSKKTEQIDAGNYDSSCLEISKDNFTVVLDMKNFAKVSTVVENCAVIGVSLERNINNDEDNYKTGLVKLPSGLGLDFEAEDLKVKLPSFEAGGSNNAENGSYNYDSADYDVSIRYYYYNSTNYSTRQVNIKNREWKY